jgi:hypothetical protein
MIGKKKSKDNNTVDIIADKKRFFTTLFIYIFTLSVAILKRIDIAIGTKKL